MIEAFPPGLVLILGALLVPLVHKRLQPAVAVLQVGEARAAHDIHACHAACYLNRQLLFAVLQGADCSSPFESGQCLSRGVGSLRPCGVGINPLGPQASQLLATLPL